MNSTFIEVMSYCNKLNDEKSKKFLEYIMLKYFNDQNIFMKISEAAPFLEKGDLEVLIPIAQSARRL